MRHHLLRLCSFLHEHLVLQMLSFVTPMMYSFNYRIFAGTSDMQQFVIHDTHTQKKNTSIKFI